MESQTGNSQIWEAEEEGCSEFEVALGFVVNPRLVCAVERSLANLYLCPKQRDADVEYKTG